MTSYSIINTSLLWPCDIKHLHHTPLTLFFDKLLYATIYSIVDSILLLRRCSHALYCVLYTLYSVLNNSVRGGDRPVIGFVEFT